METKDHTIVPELNFAIEEKEEDYYAIEMGTTEKLVIGALASCEKPEDLKKLMEMTGLDRKELVGVLASFSARGLVKRVDPDETEKALTPPPPSLDISWEEEKDENEEQTEKEEDKNTHEKVSVKIIHDPKVDNKIIKKYLESLKEKNYYDMLDLDPKCGKKDIRDVYYELVTQYHPDRHNDIQDQNTKEILSDIFSLLTEAYDTLYRKKRRRKYDMTIPDVTGAVDHEEDEALAKIFDESFADIPFQEKTSESTEEEGTEDQPPGWAFYESALESFRMGDYEAADFNFKLAVGMEPDREEYQEGFRRNSEILTKRKLEGLIEKASDLEKQKKFKEAIAVYLKAVELSPEDVELRYALARIRFLRTFDRIEAEEDISWALAIEPNHLDSLLLLGRIRAWKGDTEAANRTFRHVLKISPGCTKAKQALALFDEQYG
jgi:curved DNA-binding protein CbpA